MFFFQTNHTGKIYDSVHVYDHTPLDRWCGWSIRTCPSPHGL